MKSKTKIGKQLTRKRNPDLVETVLEARKSEKWYRVAEILTSPRKNRIEKNIDDLDKESKEGETVVIPGKVLSVGNLNKKVNVVALSFSKNAEEKIVKAGGKVSRILEEIKNNPDAKSIKILDGEKQ